MEHLCWKVYVKLCAKDCMFHKAGGCGGGSIATGSVAQAEVVSAEEPDRVVHNAGSLGVCQLSRGSNP